jgi:hypothetical protein
MHSRERQTGLPLATDRKALLQIGSDQDFSEKLAP